MMPKSFEIHLITRNICSIFSQLCISLNGGENVPIFRLLKNAFVGQIYYALETKLSLLVLTIFFQAEGDHSFPQRHHFSENLLVSTPSRRGEETKVTPQTNVFQFDERHFIPQLHGMKKWRQNINVIFPVSVKKLHLLVDNEKVPIN